MKKGASVADHVNKFNSNLSRGKTQNKGQKENIGRSKSKKRYQSKNRQNITCWNYNQKGHFQNQCPKPVASKDKEVNMTVRDYDDALLEKFRLRSSKVHLADDNTLDIVGVRDVVLKTSFGISWTLKDVRYIPDIKRRLIYVGQLDEEGYHVPFDGINTIIDGMGNATLWHKRLGHMSDKGMKILASKGGSRYYVTFIDDTSRKDLKGHKVVQSRDVTFNEDSLYGSKAETDYDTSEGSKNIGSFEDSIRSYEEDSKDEAFSKEGGSETPQVRRSTRESRASAINEEISSLEKNQTRSLVKLPAGKKALQNKWVFRVEEKQDGNKRLVLSIVAAEDLHLEQLDVKTAFLHGDLDEDIYMTQPEGFQSAGKEENLVSKLKKSLGSNHEDANEHIEKVLEIVDLFHIPNTTQEQIMLRAFSMSLTGATSRRLRNKPSGLIKTWEDLQAKFPSRQILDSKGAIPTKTAADAKIAIQEMAEYYQKWHNGTSQARSTKTSNRLAAIQAQLNNLRREIIKVNEKVYAAQVGREQCKGPHNTKDCPLKKEGKTLKEAFYTQFGVPFQQGG
nr:retrovirus-related Pol polyprotein from transposon TNT 1-94 [Tanacetum cinerariifolium]